MNEGSVDIPTNPNIAPRHSLVFHHEGSFESGTEINKGNNFGIEQTLIIEESDISELRFGYEQTIASFESVLPKQEIFPNGLSRVQAARVLAAQQTIFLFNGGVPGEHTIETNRQVYESQTDGEARLRNFRGVGGLTCAESSAIAQQLLSPSEKVVYVSGSADLHGNGTYEQHSFNLITPSDTKFESAILDIANPLSIKQTDGSLQVKLYCAPITAEEIQSFKEGKPVEVNYGGEKRYYQFGIGGKTPIVW